MANFQTVKNTLKKLETLQQETNRPEGSGVIFQDEYEKLPPATESCRNGRRNRVGYLVVPKQLNAAEWENACAK